MTRLSEEEISKFWDLIENKNWDMAAELGEQLLKKDPRDGAGIRFGIMSAYAVRGDTAKAIDLAIRYCEYAPIEKYIGGPGTYCSGLEIYMQWDKHKRDTWTKELHKPLALLLAMTYWRKGMRDEAEAIICSLSLPCIDYLTLTEEEVEEIRRVSRAKGACTCGDVSEIVCDVFVPYNMQESFRILAKLAIASKPEEDPGDDENGEDIHLEMEITDKMHHIRTYEILGTDFYVDIFYKIAPHADGEDYAEGWLYKKRSGVKRHIVDVSITEAGSISQAIETIIGYVPEDMKTYLEEFGDEYNQKVNISFEVEA